MDRRLLPETFVELADTLVADFDMVEFLHKLTDRTVPLLGASAAGLLLADPRGELRVVAASSEKARLLELFQLQADQGPCLDCFHEGRTVASGRLTEAAKRWPIFVESATDAGFTSVQALPMRLREQTIGALNLFRADDRIFSEDDVLIGQAMADIATIGLLHERSMHYSDVLNAQLQVALDSRVTIEQAKGKLAERFTVAPDDAFVMLRDYARSVNRRLVDVAYGVITGDEKPEAFDESGRGG